jgi:protein involved in polysaccharide export with SLBB domain
MNFSKTCLVISGLFALVGSALAQNEIKPGKAVQVTIKGVPASEQAKIDGQYSVTDGGVISMPYIGTVRAAGLRPGDLAASIESRYRAEGIYRTPTIQVFASSTDTMDKPFVTVGGQVRKTGPVEFTQGLTLYQAVQAAGGATEFGTVKRVVLTRNGSQRTYDITQTQFMSIPLYPSDTIEVPQKNILGR